MDHEEETDKTIILSDGFSLGPELQMFGYELVSNCNICTRLLYCYGE